MTKFAWLLAAPLLASSAWSTDLLQTYREAQDNDAVFAAARATAEAGREKEPQALAGLLPTLGVTGYTQWNENEITLRSSGTSAPANFNSNGYTITLSHYEAVPPAVQQQLVGQHKVHDEE